MGRLDLYIRLWFIWLALLTGGFLLV